jgi:hypothetical protein
VNKFAIRILAIGKFVFSINMIIFVTISISVI